MSSDLSFLIQNQNEVQVDQSYLQKYQKQPTKLQNTNSKNNDAKDPPKKEIKLKKKMTQIQSKKKKFPVKSYTSEHFPSFEDKNKKLQNPQERKSQESQSIPNEQSSKYIDLIQKRIQQMMNNQKQIQEEISSSLFDLKYVIQTNENSDKNLINMMDRTKYEIKKTQKGIGQILTLIQKHSEMRRLNEQLVN